MTTRANKPDLEIAADAAPDGALHVASPDAAPMASAADGPASDLLAASFATSYAGVVAFLTVAAEGSFAKAGDRLGIGRSAVSRSVQKLETQLGVRLFLRTTRSTSLTREGELFYANCHPGMARIEKALEDMRDLREGPPRGPLRVCATVGFGRKVVAPLLKEFCAAYPDISLDLLLDDGPTDFTSDRVDVSFRNGRMEDSQVIAKRVIPMQMVVCASADYVREHGVPLTPADLEHHLCVNFRFASGRIYEWEFKVDGHLQRVLPRARFTINDADLVLRAVRDGQALRRWRRIRSATCCGRANWWPAWTPSPPMTAAIGFATRAASICRHVSACSSIS